ncbi:hypothetical protein CAPN002_26480 [Capnocytophaga stomatis]|uniref:hypothetical protein n=1 Tax=Capnocytophaga stomatis TaxID=1848904 RepID=UPI00195293DE|nr:hypothetical protein [Capnocytophaga stomatis]GIJ95430.1 hypothetical protein CAPN002_26480 [Capnocytophaga stomatis]
MFSKNELDEMAMYILEILQVDKMVFFSWGISKAHSCTFQKMKALCIEVNGFLHKGLVYIAYNEGADTFEVFCTSLNGLIIKEAKGIYFDELTSIIDKMVEKDCSDEDYKEKLNEYYSID